MASKLLPSDKQNFIRLTIAVVDKVKLPMKDILEIYIKPVDLYSAISSNTQLTDQNQLSEDQKKICYLPSPDIPDYGEFDISLLYKLILNLCTHLAPTQGWGKQPKATDVKIGGDIERLRQFRNDMFGHVKSSTIPDSLFASLWKELEDIIKRMDIFINCQGPNAVNYEKELEDIKKRNFGYEDMLEVTMTTLKYMRKQYVSLSHGSSPPDVYKFGITIPGIDNVNHISYVTSDRLWVSDYRHLLRMDYSGHGIQKKNREIGRPLAGNHSVTEDGDLLFIDDDKVQKMTSNERIDTLIHVRGERLFCIHSSRINGDILVGSTDEITRYDTTGQKMHMRKITYYPMYITENKNGDIWVSESISEKHEAGAVVVVDKSGRYRFNYTGQQFQSDFYPRGICTDGLGRALVCDNNYSTPSVHLLDQDGQFLRLLLTREQGLHHPIALCLDDRHNLYLGQLGSDIVMVYDYLQETDVSVSSYLNHPILMSSFTVSTVNGFYHISCGTSERLWVNDDRHLLQVDFFGHEQQKEKVEFYREGGVHTVTENGDLLFIDQTNVRKLTANGTITTVIKLERETFCVHSSRMNGDILLGCYGGVVRYDKWGKRSADFSMNRTHQIYYPMYITENKNGDIWISDFLGSVLVFDKSGQYRLNYTGQHTHHSFGSEGFSHFLYPCGLPSPFRPRGICTDILGHVLVCNILDPSVHLLDQNGQFLRLLLTREHGLHSPTALCLDDKHNLYLGQENSNTITVYKYLQEMFNQ